MRLIFLLVLYFTGGSVDRRGDSRLVNTHISLGFVLDAFSFHKCYVVETVFNVLSLMTKTHHVHIYLPSLPEGWGSHVYTGVCLFTGVPPVMSPSPVWGVPQHKMGDRIQEDCI